MHRLRKRLRQFYAEEGTQFPLQIDIAVGKYAPVFKESVIDSSDVVVKPQYYGKTVVVRRPHSGRSSTPNGRRTEPKPIILPLEIGPNESMIFGVRIERDRPVVQETPPADPIANQAALSSPTPGEVDVTSGDRSIWKWVLAASLGAALLVGAGLLFRNYQHREAAKAAVSALRAVRMLAGRQNARYIDLTGRVWEGDQYFSGGKALASRSEATVFGSDPNLFASRREGEFSYAIPLEPGFYEARLWFAVTDLDVGGKGLDSAISVSVNGLPVFQNLDVARDAGGPDITDVRVLTGLEPGKDGYLRFRFSGAGFLNAIEVFPTEGPTMAPLRIICQPKGRRTQNGEYWEPDQFYDGGEVAMRSLPVIWGNDYDLLRGERYGNFQYTLPVGPGLYTVNLYMAETWFPQAADRPVHPGNRLFSIEADGVPLMTDVDPANFVSHNYHGFRLSFPHLKAPVDRGSLRIKFASLKNNANINAIEVLPE
jgi:hypothetical protein